MTLIASLIFLIASAPLEKCVPTREIWSDNCVDHIPSTDFPIEFNGGYAGSLRDCDAVSYNRIIGGSAFDVFKGEKLRATKITKNGDGDIFVEMGARSQSMIKYHLELKNDILRVTQDGQSNSSEYVKCW